MMRPKQIVYAPIAPSTNNICLLQTTAGAGNLLLNGSTAGILCSAKPWMGYKIALESTADLHAVTATITGFSENNAAQTESMACPTSNSVVSTKYWSKITTIAVDGAIGTNMKVGTSDSFASATLPVDMYDAAMSVGVDVSGTINYDLQRSQHRPTAIPAQTPNWLDGGITGYTIDGQAFFQTPTGALRLLVNTYSTGATATVHINQASTFSA